MAVAFINLSVSPNGCSQERSGLKEVVCCHGRASAIAAQINDQSRGVNQLSQLLGKAFVIGRDPGLEANIPEFRAQASCRHRWLIIIRAALYRDFKFSSLICLEFD